MVFESSAACSSLNHCAGTVAFCGGILQSPFKPSKTVAPKLTTVAKEYETSPERPTNGN